MVQEAMVHEAMVQEATALRSLAALEPRWTGSYGMKSQSQVRLARSS